jgi:putative glutamine amidotransferase
MPPHPLIAIPGHRETIEAAPFYAVRSTYLDSISAHEGIPVVVPPVAGEDELESLLDSVDGLFLPGGVDVDPARYGEQPAPQLGQVDGELDEFELALVREAYERDMPILGICRGMQVMAVALGGALYQDLPTQIPGINHEVREYGRDYLAHKITLASRSRVAEILGPDAVSVNTLHHQGVRVVPSCLAAVGWSDDDLVEALEAPGRKYVVSVQGHPEELWAVVERRFSALFASFVNEASRTGSRDPVLASLSL